MVPDQPPIKTSVQIYMRRLRVTIIVLFLIFYFAVYHDFRGPLKQHVNKLNYFLSSHYYYNNADDLIKEVVPLRWCIMGRIIDGLTQRLEQTYNSCTVAFHA
jgi:hypothetical protein